jgi:hypothetical protein
MVRVLLANHIYPATPSDKLAISTTLLDGIFNLHPLTHLSAKIRSQPFDGSSERGRLNFEHS